MAPSPPTDWDSLDAPHVPGLLAQLSSVDEEARLRALEALYEVLGHQGTLEPAAPAAAPLLVDFACTTRMPDRHRVLILLADLTSGLPERTRFGFGPDPAVLALPRGDAPLVQEVAGVVTSNGSRLVALFEDHEPRVRTAAGFLLAFAPALAEASARATTSRLQREADVRARASMVMCAGRCGRTLGQRETHAIAGAALDSTKPLVRAAAGVALAYLDDAALGPRALAALAEAARSLPRETGEVLRVDEASGLFPWNCGDVGGLAAGVLGWLGERGVDGASRALREALDARLDAGEVPMERAMPDLAAMQAMLERGSHGEPAPEPSPILSPDDVPRGSTVRTIVRALVPLVLRRPTSGLLRRSDLSPEQRELVDYLARRLPDMGPFVRDP